MGDSSRITVEVSLSGMEVGDLLGRDDAMPFIRGIVGSQSSYELDLELFEYVMENLISTARDSLASADVKLEADALITKMVTRFRNALHGGK